MPLAGTSGRATAPGYTFYTARACETGATEQAARFLPAAGAAYATGKHVKPDFARAATLYQRGCDSGDSAACGELAKLITAGQAPDRTNAQAAELYEKGCAGGRSDDATRWP
jgi:hypothetical protein